MSSSPFCLIALLLLLVEHVQLYLPPDDIGKGFSTYQGPLQVSYMGCWRFDYSTEGLRHWKANDGEGVDVMSCTRYCYTNRYTYAALFHGTHHGNRSKCMCGNWYKDSPAPFSESSMGCYSHRLRRCDGNPADVCGADDEEGGSFYVATVYKDKTVLEYQIRDSFMLYVNQMLVSVDFNPFKIFKEDDYTWINNVAIVTADTRYKGSNDGSIFVLIDGYDVDIEHWRCHPMVNSQVFTDFYLYDPKTFNPDEWDRPKVVRQVSRTAPSGTNHAVPVYWSQEPTDGILCRIDFRCDASWKFGKDCKHKNKNCIDDFVHPHIGHCILGCKSGYGPFCVPNPPRSESPSGSVNPSGVCPLCAHCKDSVCAGDGGAAFYDCPYNWQGVKCKECTDTLWGDYCEHDCPDKCTTCSNDTTCTSCQLGFYSEICNQLCQLNCGSGCEQATGRCLGGCKRGFTGNHCQDLCGKCASEDCEQDGRCFLCQSGYHGSKCTQKCSANCVGACNQKTASCNGDCVIGYYGSTCSKRCPLNCASSCHDINGRCDACKIGFQGATCQHKCPAKCRDQKCDQYSGACTIGCKTGYKGSQCNSRCGHCGPLNCEQDGECRYCEPGFYGSKCTLLCPTFCTGGICDEKNGTCSLGCVEGFTGWTCEQTCPVGCLGTCDISGGICFYCKPLMYGYWCNETCPGNCKGTECGRLNGTCPDGCKKGFSGLYCSNLVFQESDELLDLQDASILAASEEPDVGNFLPLILGSGMGTAAVTFFTIIMVVTVVSMCKPRQQRPHGETGTTGRRGSRLSEYQRRRRYRNRRSPVSRYPPPRKEGPMPYVDDENFSDAEIWEAEL